MDRRDVISSGTIRKEIELRRFNRKFEKNDPIKDFEGFASLVKELSKLKFDVNCSNARFEDSRFYGYYRALQQYADYPQRCYPVLSGIEHGVRFGTLKWPYYDYHTCYVCEGTERIHEISDVNPWMPVVAVGPYIHYASQYYAGKELRKMKEELGRVLLVFPSHSCEWVPRTFGSDIVEYIFNRYAPDFDTVMVCSYWRDVDSREIRKFQEYGAKLVSAGFRGDVNFIRRLKSIISLADLVMANDIGTNIGFACCLGKPFVLEGDCLVRPEDPLYTENYRRLFEAFSWGEKGAFSDEQLKQQKDLYQRIWGGGLEKSREELFRIFAVIDRLLRASRYNVRRMHELVQSEWKKNRVLTDLEQQILRKMIHCR